MKTFLEVPWKQVAPNVSGIVQTPHAFEAAVVANSLQQLNFEFGAWGKVTMPALRCVNFIMA